MSDTIAWRETSGWPPPIARDVAEQPVLDRVPLACAGRKVTDADLKARVVGEALKLGLPQAQPIAV
jgi:hypothetical protein